MDAVRDPSFLSTILRTISPANGLIADAIATHFEELSNYQLIAKEDDPDGFIIQPKTGKKG